jgi:hypothetical protein
MGKLKSSILNAFSGIIGKVICSILCGVSVMVEEQEAKFKVASYEVQSIQAVGSWYAGGDDLFVPVIINDKVAKAFLATGDATVFDGENNVR